MDGMEAGLPNGSAGDSPHTEYRLMLKLFGGLSHLQLDLPDRVLNYDRPGWARLIAQYEARFNQWFENVHPGRVVPQIGRFV